MISEHAAWQILQEAAAIPGRLKIPFADEYKDVVKVEPFSGLLTIKGRVRAWSEDGSYVDALPSHVLTRCTSHLRPAIPHRPSAGSVRVVGTTTGFRVRSGEFAPTFVEGGA